jgi:ATP-dependent RNA helicase DDX5/DBP2
MSVDASKAASKKSKKRKNETPEERAARKALKKQKLLQPKPRSDSFSKPAALPAPERAAATPSAPAEAKPSAPAGAEPTFAAFAKEHAVELSGSEPVPVVEFAKAPFNAACQQKLAKEGFAKPTPTQSVSWPLALTGTDLISIAKTGSGKTLGFLLPAFHRIEQKFERNSATIAAPKIVVMAPTRELALQIASDAAKFAPCFGGTTAVCYGGAPKWEQIKKLRWLNNRGCVVATPGRLNDLQNQGKIFLNEVDVLVLDEADRMLDMGFEPQIREVVSRMPPRQTMLFTATWGKDVQKVARTLVQGEPTRVSFGDAASGKLTANKDVTQTIEIVESWRDKKVKAIERLKALHKDSSAKTIVFLATKRACDEVANELWYSGMKCDSIHGDKEQRERDRVIGQFRRNEVMCLIATDVAARGLDVSDVTNVVQIDFPAASGKAGVEDYIHRIGRTGRAGRKGSAHAYLTKDDIKANGRVLVAILRDAGQEVPAELAELTSRAGGKGGGKGGRGRGRGRGFGRGRGRGGGFGKGQKRKW